MRNMVKILCLLFYLLSSLTSAQSDSSNLSINKKLLSRTRIINGVSGLSLSKTNQSALFYLNTNFRSSSFTDMQKFFSIGIASEPGVNIIFAPKDGGIVLVPYGKVGPEISLSNNFFLAANVGMVGIIYPQVIGIITFIYGANIFYLIKISEDNYIELETGFHSPVQAPNTMLFYLAVGISFN